MATRTVRFDKETERVLSEVRAATGLPISEVLKRGVRALRTQESTSPDKTPYEVFAGLDLGSGGSSIATSSETRLGVRLALKRKLRR
jgi:hypothetical protein